MRPIWQGQIRISLVSIPVELYSATKSGARIAFRQIHEPSGQPVKYEKVVPGIGPVDANEIMKGYELEKGNYVLLSPEEIDAVKLETKKTLELVQFVGACEIPPLYFNKSYYVVPADKLAEDAYRVVRDALRKTGRFGLGQLTLRGHEYVAAVKACGDGMLLETLHYFDEIRTADPLFASISDDDVDEELLEVATALIEKKSGAFDAQAFKDNLSAALQALIAQKSKSKSSKRIQSKTDPTDNQTTNNVVDLMSALKKSLEKTPVQQKNNKNKGSRKKRGI